MPLTGKVNILGRRRNSVIIISNLEGFLNEKKKNHIWNIVEITSSWDFSHSKFVHDIGLIVHIPVKIYIFMWKKSS